MMDKAISAYYTITASSEFREIERLREKARHDEAQALYHAKLEGRLEGRQEGVDLTGELFQLEKVQPQFVRQQRVARSLQQLENE